MSSSSVKKRTDLKMIDEVAELLELLYDMYIVKKVELVGKVRPFSGKWRECFIEVGVKKSQAVVVVRVGGRSGEQLLWLRPREPCSLGFLCKTLISRMRAAGAIREVREVATPGGYRRHRFEDYGRISHYFKMGKEKGMSFDEACEYIADRFKVKRNEIPFWYRVHADEAGFRGDTDWLMPGVAKKLPKKNEPRMEISFKEEENGRAQLGSGLEFDKGNETEIELPNYLRRAHRILLEHSVVHPEQEDKVLVEAATHILEIEFQKEDKISERKAQNKARAARRELARLTILTPLTPKEVKQLGHLGFVRKTPSRWKVYSLWKTLNSCRS